MNGKDDENAFQGILKQTPVMAYLSYYSTVFHLLTILGHGMDSKSPSPCKMRVMSKRRRSMRRMPFLNVR